MNVSVGVQTVRSRVIEQERPVVAMRKEAYGGDGLDDNQLHSAEVISANMRLLGRHTCSRVPHDES